MKKDSLTYPLGIFCLIYWLFDVINMIFIIHKPEFMLWYSSAGLFFTAIALITGNSVLISIMFCSLFLVESIWSLDFLGKIFFNKNFLGITSYVFSPSYSKKDFFMTMYHIFLPPILFFSVLKTKKVFRYSWAGSTVYLFVLLFLTYTFVSRSETVNCVHQLSQCKGLFSSIASITPNPYRVFVILTVLVVFVFIPTNYILLKIGKKRKWKVL